MYKFQPFFLIVLLVDLPYFFSIFLIINKIYFKLTRSVKKVISQFEPIKFFGCVSEYTK